METWYSIAGLTRAMNLCMGAAAVFGLLGGALSGAAFVMQLRRDVVSEDRHVSPAAAEAVARELRIALRGRTPGGFTGVAAPGRDRDVSQFVSELQGTLQQAGIGGMGGGGIPEGEVPNRGLVVVVDRAVLPDLDLAGILSRAGLRAVEMPEKPPHVVPRVYNAGAMVIVTDKP